ncbi:MAG: hypothetical protein J7515_17475 [Caulobacter sp.]|nr:hypothetical protein [Caulobacter sp.]
MQRTFLVLAVSVAALASFMTPTVEAASKKTEPAQCFRPARMVNWMSDDDRTLYVKLNTGAVFQVDLANDCPGLTTYRTMSFNPDFGEQICNGRAGRVISRSGAGPLACEIKSVRALTKDEAKALPDKQRP